MSQQQDYRNAIVDALLALKKRELANKQPFKARAYGAVLQQLQARQGRQARQEPIYTMADLADIKGMGEKIKEKIEEIFETGRLQSAEDAKENYHLDAHDELQGIYGIGPAKATTLIEQGIHSVTQLRKEVERDTSILNDKQRIGLLYYEDLLQRIPRQEMEQHEQLLLEKSPFHAELVGSYRRGSPDSGDIDVLLRVPKGQGSKEIQSAFYQYVQRLIDEKYIVEILALGPHKCMGIVSLPGQVKRRLDLLITPDEEYACALLYFTGSDRFNVAFRQHALQQGYTLNEHRLQPLQPLQPLQQPKEVPVFQEEQGLFHFLGLEYVPPQERVDATSLRLRQVPLRVKRPQRA